MYFATSLFKQFFGLILLMRVDEYFGLTVEEKLFQDLFLRDDYSATVRPVKNKSMPVKVQMNIAYVQLVALDDRDQSLTSNIWIRQFWQNDFLTWNPTDYGGLKEITVDKKWLWKPDLVLYNSATGSLNSQLDQHKTRVIVRNDGFNTWYIPTIMDSSCSIDIQYFPFDYQKCELKFGSWTYLGTELNLSSTRNDIDLTNYQESSVFQLLGTKAVRNVVYYKCCPDPYIDVTFTLVLKRQPYHYIYNIIIPSSVLTFFALFIFAYPDETGERMGLAIQCFLTISILTILVADMMPIDSNVTPLLVRYMTTCMIAMTASIIMNAVSLNLNREEPVPAWLHDLVFNKVAPMVMFQSCWHSIRKKGKLKPSAFCEGVFAAIIRKKLRDAEEHQEENEEFHDQNCNTKEHISVERHGSPYDSIRTFQSLPFVDMIEIAKKNHLDAKNMAYLSERVLDEIQTENNMEFWRCCSQTFDRLCLILFLLAYVFVAMVLFLLVPIENF